MMLFYAVRIPFMNSYMYLTEGTGSGARHKLFSTLEEASEVAEAWEGKVVEVIFNEEFEE